MEQFNSGESNFISEINFHKFLVGQMIVGKFAWQQDLIFQEQFFTSVLFKDTQDVISLILCNKTM